jgi:tetratricopeptide (TPR) repeat protein
MVKRWEWGKIMSGRKMGAIALFLTSLMTISMMTPVLAETDYQRWLRMAETARKNRNYDTALTYYQRAAEFSPNGYNDPDINEAIGQVLEERVQSFQRSSPNYVRYIRIADRAYSNGEYDTAILNYRRALRQRPNDRYATIRIRQSECIKRTRPQTGAQFRTFGCPSF